MKKIIYIGNFSFPLGNAAGKRVYGNGKLFNEGSINATDFNKELKLTLIERFDEVASSFDTRCADTIDHTFDTS